jgi:NADPH-dependent 2,4-dienoyl-CoA reductase/sulfur reductase-like enzyme
MRRIVVVGGSIAAVTAADALRLNGFAGDLTLISSEAVPPYSRVPLSKGVLAGSQDPESVWLEQLPESIDVRLSSPAVALRPDHGRLDLADGSEVRYDGLVIATGATPVRLANPGQEGELVVRDLTDASTIAGRVETASTAVVIGGGFLGMEIASTLTGLGLAVTVIDREPPLRRLLGAWLSEILVRRARAAGVRFVVDPGGVELIGSPVEGVRLGQGEQILADLTITAAGDRPAVDWLATSGLRVEGGLVVDRCCRVRPDITAAGDVTVVEEPHGALRRTPHWTSAIEQARTAARCLLDAFDTTPYQPDPYFWTEQFGLDVKISGHPPALGEPDVLARDPQSHSALVQWTADGRPHAAASINHRIPIIKLKKLRTHTLTPSSRPR